MTDEDIALIDPAVRTIDAVERYFGVPVSDSLGSERPGS
jgi:hypothetical protein